MSSVDSPERLFRFITMFRKILAQLGVYQIRRFICYTLFFVLFSISKLFINRVCFFLALFILKAINFYFPKPFFLWDSMGLI